MKDIPEYALRTAVAQDRRFIYDLHAATLREYVDRTWGWDDADQWARFECRFRPAAYQIVRAWGADAGVIQVERTAEGIRLSNIQVAPQYQGRGLGSALLCDLLGEAQAKGQTVWLQVLRVNPARRLYERLGFSCIGETSTHYQMVAHPRERERDDRTALRGG